MRTKSLKSLHLGRSIAVTCMSVALLATPTLITAQNTPESRKLASEKITLRISDAPLSSILKQMEQKAGIRISIYGAIPGINQKTTLNARNRTIKSILEELLSKRGVTIVYGDNRNISLSVPEGSGSKEGMVKVAGIVRDAETGETLIGATVTITDGSGNSTGKGCVTDLEGKYVLELPRKSSIQVSYMGYKQISMQIMKSRSNLDFELKPNSVDMGDVVVTGISKRSKNSFTGNFVTVDGAELVKLSPGNILKGLQYFDPSFKIVENNNAGSDPNAQLDFRIRGDQALGSNREYSSMELMLLADEGFEDSFETLLESRIRVRLEEVVKEQKSEMDIEEEMLARVNVLQEVSKTMAEQLGREATLAELAERMKMTEDEVREIMKVTMDALSMSEINRSLQS